MLPEVALQGVSWHQHKHILAFVSGSTQVTVRDYEDSGEQLIILFYAKSRLSYFFYFLFVCLLVQFVFLNKFACVDHFLMHTSFE